VLASWIDAHGNPWVKIRVPKRPHGSTGWVPRASLRQYTIVRQFLDIDRRRLRATLYRSGRRLMSARIGIGTAANPTPRGRFYVREKFRVRTSAIYGPYALGTSAYAPRLTDWPAGGVIGLHGTDQPGLIPGRPFARLHPPTQREHHAPVPADPARDAHPHPRLSGGRRRRCAYRPAGWRAT
jgi:L,D-transpeptidase catalytic domain